MAAKTPKESGARPVSPPGVPGQRLPCEEGHVFGQTCAQTSCGVTGVGSACGDRR